MHTLRTALLVILLAAPAATVQAQATQVAETDPLPPREQLKQFQLPPGFEAQLVVSEPEIGQPMNLNFDSAGRLH